MADGFDIALEQPQAAQILHFFLTSRRIPHALLFTGIEGVGKQAAATRLAMACNCKAALPEAVPIGDTPEASAAGIPCGECSACRRILSGNHPDMITVAPSGAAIKIGQIRELLQTLTLKPYEADSRFVVITQSEKMNPAAANAFLKVLEEPPQRTFIILITEQKTDLLPTILSRCQVLPFKPIPANTLRRKLLQQELCAPERAPLIAAMAGGSWTRAQKYTQPAWLQRRDRLLTALGQLHRRPLRFALILAERLAADKTALDALLLIMETWLRDAVVMHYDINKVINQDQLERLRDTAAAFSDTMLGHQLQALDATRRNLQFSANTRLTMEMLMLKMAGRL